MAHTTLKDLAELLLVDYDFRGRKSRRRVEQCISHLKDFFGEKQRAAELSTTRVKEYIKHRQSQRAANGTINRELAALRRMFSLGISEDPPLVHHVPYLPKMKEAPPRQGFLTHEQYEKLHDALPDYLRPVFTFAYQTGWRKAEILGLQWNNAHLKEGIIVLKPGTTKNDEGRKVFMDDVVRKVVMNQLRDRMRHPTCPYVFHRNGHRIGSFRKAWAEACKKAGVGDMLFHDLRRTAVRDMVRQGIHDKVAMQITGHKTRSVFDRYNIISEEDLRAAAQKRSQNGNQA